mgnify:FL=1|tara:strand:- start:10 stop:321 length:312 start_codon:yes stop_codon:yes gene_type:complete
MASGVYGKVDVSSASTWTEIVAASAGTKVATLNVVNRQGAATTVRVALRDAVGNVTDADCIEYDVSLPANGVLERTGIVLDSSNGLHVYASAAVSAVVYGIDS